MQSNWANPTLGNYWLGGVKTRVLHAVVWPDKGKAKPLCGNRGDFPLYYTPAEEAPARPICTRCTAETKRLANGLGEMKP
jgi:hypothetical protein